eukprot:CAMPEP_0114510426 /NCGR_PEP_ID=MMETSP0109-20121206/13780_1 /TAXON_ID=29199 /ORGANISM="Chlorarachnion reptans, Strain CCCM449" /LENGTH=176 /DNA_ID=CAMNT_0001689731 /DNA_START=14 /DNA_END=544 /DNA_ORIENTATION=-
MRRAFLRPLRLPARRLPRAATSSGAVERSPCAAVRGFADDNSKKKKKKGKKQRATAEQIPQHEPWMRAVIDTIVETKPEEMWTEDRTPEQVALDTEYYKEIQRRQLREARRRNKELSRKIRAKKRAFEALPEDMKKQSLAPDKTPFPYEIGPWTDTPPIPGYDPSKSAVANRDMTS